MNISLKACLLVVGVGMAVTAADATAAVASHSFRSNSVNYCQAFTPGPANTIRNRVVGAENVGTASIAVACNFASMSNGGVGVTNPTNVYVYFANNNTTGTLTVTCTLLTGYQAQGGTTQYASTKTTAAIAAGGTSQAFLTWGPTDNPNAGATTLGNSLIGINCTLPQGAVINDTYFFWTQDNGI
jgi:hypothetical protein